MFSQQIEELKESYQEKLENTFEMYKDAIKEHAYQSARSSLEEEILAEQQKVEVGGVVAFTSRSEDLLIQLFLTPGNRSCCLRRSFTLGLVEFRRSLNPGFQCLTVKSALQALTRRLSELEASGGSSREVRTPPTEDQSCQTQTSTAAAEGQQRSRLTQPIPESFTNGCFSLSADDRYKRLHREKRSLERMCEDKQEVNGTNQRWVGGWPLTRLQVNGEYLAQLIVSLERRLMELKETLEKVRDAFLHKSSEVELLQKKVDEQVRQLEVACTLWDTLTVLLLLFVMEAKSVEDVLEQNASKDGQIAALKAELVELAQLAQKPTAESRPRRGLLANLREAVTSPRKSTATRSLRKNVRTPHQ